MPTPACAQASIAELLRPTDQSAQRIEQLRETVKYHADRYHNQDSPLVSDHQYDQLFQCLRLLESRHPEHRHPDSPTNRVLGQVATGFRKSDHASPMLSLANAFDQDDIDEWVGRTIKALSGRYPILVAEPKIDGLAVRLTYENGRLTGGATRGDGITGEEVTHNLLNVRGIPLTLANRPPAYLEIRGEVYLPVAEFTAVNRQQEAAGLSPFVSPRNAAAGTIRQFDPAVTQQRNLGFWAYAIEHDSAGNAGVANQWDALDALAGWGFPVPPLGRVCHTADDIINYHQGMLEKRETLDYEIDGIVIKVNDIAEQDLLGDVSREPRWAIAWKFPPGTATTRLQDITVSVGRMGQLTPQAVLEPVAINGITISAATLHNEDDIIRKDIRVGDLVTVERAGDVIPQVVGPVDDPEHRLRPVFAMPANCPSCDQPAMKDPENANRRCDNPDCPAQRLRRLEHFASKDAMDIQGLGPQWCALLIGSGAVRTPDDLYQVTQQQMKTLPGMGDKMAANLLVAIDASRARPFQKALYALGIPHVGRTTSRLLTAQFNDLDAISNATNEQLADVETVGETTIRSLRAFFASPENRRVAAALQNAGVNFHKDPEPPKERTTMTQIPTMETSTTESSQNQWQGKTIVITGKLALMTRAEAEHQVTLIGARPASSVTAKTDLLVVGEKPGSKLTKANSLGIPVITEQEFMDQLAA